MYPFNTLDHLPSEILDNVFQWLDLKDILSLRFVSKRLNQATSSSLIWKRFCKKYWLNEKICNEEEEWIDHFKHIYHDWGRYLECYVEIKTIWNSLENYFEANCPLLLETLNEGTTDENLDYIETFHKISLPKHLRCFYRIHNGQIRETQVGFFSHSSFHHMIYSVFFLDIEKAVSLSYHKAILAFGHCNDSDTILGCCLKPLHGGLSQETVFYTEGSYSGYFIKAPSFLSFMQEYTTNIVMNKLTLENQILHSFYRNPEWQATTHGITITVGILFRPDLSSVEPPTIMFSYHINMSMDKNLRSLKSYRLETRYWKIQTGDNEEIVDGFGVVGEYPVMYPGASFSWMSYNRVTKLNTSCTMSGYFRMKNITTDEMIQVECPAFTFQHPPIYFLENRTAH